MKKISLLVALLPTLALANPIYTPTQNEIKVIEMLFNDDVDGYINDSGESLIAEKLAIVNATADELLVEYSANELRADKKFKGKEIFIKGTVSAIKSDVRDEPYVEIKTKHRFYTPQARFIKSEEDKVIELNKGDKLKLFCKGAGELAGIPLLSDCVFSTTKSEQIKNELVSEYEQLLKGDIDGVSKKIRELAYFVNILSRTFNDFKSCDKQGISNDCLSKLLTAENVKKAKEKHKEDPLIEYLKIKK
ncbi:OB-fold protein [Pasteurella multocida]|uniref:OB-fold protein n=1 Tax=Pasteurella multocida TaxID=747 RepID=UPI0032F9C2F2|nr:hypothetical protein [Pasteurella multocida]HDR1014738.1 hypothetical protein [Pasteurella multocida]HDR1017692.1 hypothetical protein [Pasteurella multocida]HDR1209196.1 hypothetical protein [Pasteurella multocida]HDR1246180.1 hypothetical protein [Pasteurella multocida]